MERITPSERIEAFQSFKEAFKNITGHFTKLHIHTTFECKPEKQLSKKLRVKTLILPHRDGTFFSQHQTSITISGKDSALQRKQFIKICSLLENLIPTIIGYKIEGLVENGDMPPSRSSLPNDFIYIEEHEKSNQLLDFEQISCIPISANETLLKFYTARRIYPSDLGDDDFITTKLINLSEYEIAVYDDQLLPFERQWLENEKTWETLMGYLNRKIESKN